MPLPPKPHLNYLLAALPSEVLERLLPNLELVPLPLGKVLYESGDTLRHVYFPIDCIVSLLYVMENGASAEISVVGREGIIGIALFMGGESTPSLSSSQVEELQKAVRALEMKVAERDEREDAKESGGEEELTEEDPSVADDQFELLSVDE